MVGVTGTPVGEGAGPQAGVPGVRALVPEGGAFLYTHRGGAASFLGGQAGHLAPPDLA